MGSSIHQASPGRGLIYRRHSHLRIKAYSDAGYRDRKSTTGYCTYIRGNLITWKSRKHKVVSCSSAESEYRAIAETAQEMVWLRSFLEDLNISSLFPMPMHCDNQAAIFIANNFTFHEHQSTLRLTATTYETRLCPESSPLLM